jgi:gliding motility-associated-like protein
LKQRFTYFFILLCSALSAQKYDLLPDTLGICPGSSDSLEVKPGIFSKTAAYEWYIPSKGIIYNTKKVQAKITGMYVLKVHYNKATYADTCYVLNFPKPKLSIRDTSICNNTYAVIDPKNPAYKYTWSTDETSPRLKIDSPGKYWVKISNHGCSVVDTFNVLFSRSSTPNFGSEVTFCMSDENKSLSIKPNPGTKVSWNNGSTSSSIIPTKDGWYWVKSENKICGTSIDSVHVKLKACDCEILVPNSFTPNEDERNDYFFPVLSCEYSFYNLIVFDRWQNPVFTSNNINGKWDGRFKGNLCPDDIYFWRIETIEKSTEKKMVRTGQISLFR